MRIVFDELIISGERRGGEGETRGEGEAGEGEERGEESKA